MTLSCHHDIRTLSLISLWIAAFRSFQFGGFRGFLEEERDTDEAVIDDLGQAHKAEPHAQP